MAGLNFDTGLKEFEINGDPSRTITFCPTDFNFIQSMYDSFMKLEATQKKWAAVVQTVNGDIQKLRDTVNSADKEIRGIIDDLFGDDASEKAFGKLSTYALAQGAPIWAGFMVAVMDQCDSNFTANQTATNPKLEKLLKKYKK